MPKQFTYDTPRPVALAAGTRPKWAQIHLNNGPTVTATVEMVQFDVDGNNISGTEVDHQFTPSDALLDLLSQECCDQVVAKASEGGKAIAGVVEAVPVALAGAAVLADPIP